jgi:hypothetical protein
MYEAVRLFWIEDRVYTIVDGVTYNGVIKRMDKKNAEYVWVLWDGVVTPCLIHTSNLSVRKTVVQKKKVVYNPLLN